MIYETGLARARAVLLGLARRKWDLVTALVEYVASATHRPNWIILRGTGPESFSEAADVNVDRAAVDIGVAPPHAVKQLLTRQHAADIFQEEGEQTKFRWAEFDFATA